MLSIYEPDITNAKEDVYKRQIYLSDGNEAGDWNNFIINSDDTIRKDPFFYSVTKGNICLLYTSRCV